MNEQEYRERIMKIENQYTESKNKLHAEFMLKNTLYKIGDIITDGREKIRVNGIGFTLIFSNPAPEIVYTGFLLTKDNTPCKNGLEGRIRQSRIKEENHEQ